MHKENTRVTLDEKIVRKKNIPAHIVFWTVALGLLYLFYKALTTTGFHQIHH